MKVRIPSLRNLPTPTLFGRAVLLISLELAANVLIWIVAGFCFGGRKDGVIGTALLAWTIGLRHGLDADHISAIDNATRQMVNLGQRPMTVGLFFSLGHSTIVIVVNVALAISLSVYSHFDSIGSIGSVIGTSISASFLFLIAMFNLYFLVKALKDRKKMKRAEARGEVLGEVGIQGGGVMVRLVGKLMRVIDKPWKMYPIGILFGFGFDTASSIALLAISIVAARGTGDSAVSRGKIVVLPLLFTAGMSLVDSLDSIFMLYAYLGPEGYQTIKSTKWRLVERKKMDTILLEFEEVENGLMELSSVPDLERREHQSTQEQLDAKKSNVNKISISTAEDALPTIDKASGMQDSEPYVHEEPAIRETPAEEAAEQAVYRKTQTMSELSIVLMAMSIAVALSISLIEIIGIIGEHCTSCTEAAEAEDGGGLAGRWWRFWSGANDNSGIIGAGIVGAFVLVTLGWYLIVYLIRKQRSQRLGAIF